MDIKTLFKECGEITKEHGFDVTQHTTQLLLIASECAEAIECTMQANNFQKESDTFKCIRNIFLTPMNWLQDYRGTSENHIDNSYVVDYESFLEELADIQIRIASFVGGNDFTDDFIKALEAKMEKNKTRPMLHGKSF